MEEYKSNSHKSRQNQNDDIPEKRVEKVVSGSVKSKKKNGLQKITNVFVPEDVDDVKSYIFEDIVVPAVKDIILDAVRAFLGVSGNSRVGRSSTSSKISYRKYYDDRDRRDSGNVSRTRTGYDYDDIILESRGEAKMSWKEWTSLLPHTRWSALQISMISSVCQVTIQTINMDGLIFGMHL